MAEQVGDKSKTPAWRLAVGGAGWLVTIAGCLFGISGAIARLAKGGSLSLVVFGFLGSISAAILFGRFLVVAASAGQAEGRVHRLRLWARLLRIVGLLLCISWPCFLLREMFLSLELLLRFGAQAYFQFPYRDYVEGALPAILLGLVAIGCAEMWGRHGPTPDVSDVFS